MCISTWKRQKLTHRQIDRHIYKYADRQNWCKNVGYYVVYSNILCVFYLFVCFLALLLVILFSFTLNPTFEMGITFCYSMVCLQIMIPLTEELYSQRRYFPVHLHLLICSIMERRWSKPWGKCLWLNHCFLTISRYENIKKCL